MGSDINQPLPELKVKLRNLILSQISGWEMHSKLKEVFSKYDLPTVKFCFSWCKTLLEEEMIFFARYVTIIVVCWTGRWELLPLWLDMVLFRICLHLIFFWIFITEREAHKWPIEANENTSGKSLIDSS